METKKSKVTKVQANTRSYQSQHGTMYVHRITFENGDEGDYSSKQNVCSKFTVGQVADYTIEIRMNGAYENVIIKPVQSQQGGYGQNQFSGKRFAGNESLALSYAKDFSIAYIEKGKEIGPEKVCEVADKFYMWLEGKKAPQPAAAQSTANGPAVSKDGLPF